MDVTKRQPLADQNGTLSSSLRGPSKLPQAGSRLPQPGSRLPTPASKLKPPTNSSKRSRSPEQAPQKKARVDGLSTTSRLTAKPAVKAPAAKTTRPVTRPAVSRTTARAAPAKTTTAAPVRRAPTRQTSGSSLSGRNSGGSKTAAPAAPKAGGGGGGKKRPAWDLKGRLEDMEAMLSKNQNANMELNSHIQSNNGRIQLLETINQQLKGTVSQKEIQTSEASREIADLQQKLRESENEIADSVRKFGREIEDLKFSKSTLERQRETLEGELSASKQEVSGLKGTVAQLTSAQAGLNAEFSATKLNLEQALEAGRMKDAEIAKLKSIVAAHEETIEDNNSKLREHETVRRKLHNTIQELKGNIRVFCRVRPLLGEELIGSDGTIQHITFPEDNSKVLELEKLAGVCMNESTVSHRKGDSNKYEFSFDKVFTPESTQGQVFEEISQLVQSALDGYNVCIFAYGQTGSGKTHTMEGPNDPDEVTEGMIPRAVRQIFETASQLEEHGWQYQFDGSFLEIYNETIRDLLGNGKDDVKHDIKMTGNASNDVMVTNLTVVPVISPEKVHSLLKKASENRAVAETKCNERSSRSHSVFRLKITGLNEITKEGCEGTLNLIDLAGSERLKESKSEGARLKETQAINKSLSNLGNVIMALANKDNHIPYRNSKLTYLLQNSLGGNSKTLMFVNVSPREENFSETLCSLRFATKVNNCNIGTASQKKK